MPIQKRDLGLLLVFFLLGGLLRFRGMAEMASILHHDEAYNGLDALSLVQAPRLQLYFPANTGREGLWMYLVAPFVAALDAQPLALRIPAILVGISTLAAAYWLAREMFQKGAVWVVGVLAVLYWHMHLSHLGFRAITFPLIGALGLAALLRAHRYNRAWLIAGLLCGLILYTYLAAYVYVAYAALWLLWWAVRSKTLRRGALMALSIIIVMTIPLLIERSIPSDTSTPITRTAAKDLEQVGRNIQNWTRAWFEKGDDNADHNIAARPILDWPLGILLAWGLIAMWGLLREKWLLLWWLGLVFASFLPTILSINTPHYLRGAGLILPLVLLIGAGAALLSRWRVGLIAALLFIFWAGWHSYQDFGRWLQTTDEFGIYIDSRITEGMNRLDAELPDGMPIMMPGLVYHPIPAFLAAGMHRPITFYEWPDGECYLSYNRPYAVLDLPIVLNSFARRVEPFADELMTVFQHPQAHYNIYQVQPTEELASVWDHPVRIADLMQTRVVQPTVDSIAAGETLRIYLGIRLEQQPQSDYHFLVHLQGHPTPYEGGRLYSTGDAPLCALAYSDHVNADHTLVQQLSLPVPADLAPGDYDVALGLYLPETGQRLAIQAPENPYNYSEAWHIRVRP